MYQPPMFREENSEKLGAAMREIGFACIVTPDEGGLHATHVPVVVKGEGNAPVLEFHVARANPHWRLAGAPAETIAIFQGPQTYIHPGWYASKAETGQVVPTWCYVAIHLHGRLDRMRDDDELSSHLDELTLRNESGRAEPWAVSDAPADYIAKRKRAIVGLRLHTARVEGTWKLNQHRSEADRAGVIDGLSAEVSQNATKIAELMKDVPGK